MNSVDTRQPDRDKDLRSDHFFDAEKITGLTEDEHLNVIKEQQALRELKRQPLSPLGDNHNEPF